MYITKEQLNERLDKTGLLVVERERALRKKKVTDKDGNIISEGEKRLNHEDRTLIGVLSELDTCKNIADLVGVSAQTVSNSSRGLTSPTIGLDKELQKDVNEGITSIANKKISDENKIQEQLLTNLAAALGHVANNIGNTDAPEASKIAVDMSKILDRVSGNGDKDSKGNRTAIIINVPPMKEERSYQTITV